MAKKSKVEKKAPKTGGDGAPGRGSAKTMASAKQGGAGGELVYVANSPLHGKGLFARTRLKANLTLGKLEGRPTRRDGTYVLWLTDTEGLRVTNDFRFINHSATPNCALTDTEVVTLKSVKADEELTHNYGW